MLSHIKYIFDALFAKRVAPAVSPNTFFVWEPCSDSHAEVVPGYVKYLLDLGFDVSVFVTPKRLDEGLFSRFSHARMAVNRMSQPAIIKHFKKHGLSNAHGILITTARKIGAKDSYRSEYDLFANRSHHQRVLLVEHDVKSPADHRAIDQNIITLRKPNYKNVVTSVVNPHYFGNVNATDKSTEVVNFITVGALRVRRRNTSILIDAVATLRDKGIDNFKITVIGRGSLRGIPDHLRKHFDIKGRVDFLQLYAELESADFFLALLDPDNPLHERYLTTGTSGNFQLILGFAKPCLIANKFALPNGFNQQNSIAYANNIELASSMIEAINMTQQEYRSKQQFLQQLAASIYTESLSNMKVLTTSPTVA
jgi:glycosyltransferase involved in cell wall biosynthesis